MPPTPEPRPPTPEPRPPNARLAFDHRDQGTPEEAWADHAGLRGAPPLALPRAGTHLIVVAAHPDDESLGAGALIAAAAAQGARVDVVVATDGEASHPGSPTHTPARLGPVRRREVRDALRRLAPQATVVHLGLPDGRLDTQGPALVAAIDHLLTPGALLVTPWRRDRHPDHEACALAARVVLRDRPDCQHWQYPIWAWHWADPHGDGLPWDTIRRLDAEPGALRAKRAALACHRSQHQPLSLQPGDEALLDASFLRHFQRTYETFVVEAAHPAGRPAYFEGLYAAADDPWDLERRFYEQRKRDVLLAALPRPRFARAFEPGCATGLLTERLAERCDRVEACDAAARPVALARARVSARASVTVTRRVIPADWPEGTFDLIVLSEVAYYCDDLAQLTRAVRRSLAAGGVVVGCHWRHPAPDHPHRATVVHDALGAGLHRIVQHVEDDFLLDVWSTDPASVARRTGVIE